MEIFNNNGFVPEEVLDTDGNYFVGIITKNKYLKEDYEINFERKALIVNEKDEYFNCIIPVIFAYNNDSTLVYKCKLLNKYYKLEDIKFV